jgi:hypothetical protein
MMTKRRSNVLDIVREVTRTAGSFPEIRVWWYVPRLLDNPKVELVLECEPGATTSFERIAADVQRGLHDVTVEATAHQPSDIERRLFRILTRDESAPRTR